MANKFRIFFFRYWWIYYSLIFFIIGWIVYLLVHSSDYGNYNASISEIKKQINNCDCKQDSIVHIDNQENLNDSLRVIDNEGDFGCLSFTLVWNSTDDLDLHVVDVNSEHIYFKRFCKGYDNLFTKAGGQLDIDLNTDENKTNNPVENVYFKCFPTDGDYKVFVHAFEKENTLPLSFNVIVREKGKVVKQIEGSIRSNKENKFVMDYLYKKNEIR